jgi:hypothetical protein
VRDAIRLLHDRKLRTSEVYRRVDPFLSGSIYILYMLPERACIQNCSYSSTNLPHVYRSSRPSEVKTHWLVVRRRG